MTALRPLRGAISTAASTTGRKYQRNSGPANDMESPGRAVAPPRHGESSVCPQAFRPVPRPDRKGLSPKGTHDFSGTGYSENGPRRHLDHLLWGHDRTTASARLVSRSGRPALLPLVGRST